MGYSLNSFIDTNFIVFKLAFLCFVSIVLMTAKESTDAVDRLSIKPLTKHSDNNATHKSHCHFYSENS